MNDAGDLFNELYYIYKDKYNEEINSMKTKGKNIFDHTKLRLTDDYQYDSENEKKNRLLKN